jgi:tRNA A-37 threonylcarbamoyl transferase component Bud32
MLWERVENIYHAALPLGGGERAAYVANACAGDASLYEKVCSLLAEDAGAADFLREPAAGLAWALLADERLAETLVVTEVSPRAPADLVGTKVASRYEVMDKLGEGGFGEVYKALDAHIMSRPVVIKVLKDAALSEEGEKRDWLLTKFRQEIEALSRIQDSGIVGIFDADTLPDGRPYLVMEFVKGSNLRDFIRKANKERGPERGLRLRDVAEIVRQVARTLTAAHDEDVVHRDLKPENVMVHRGAGGDLHVKVIDFGIAKVRNSLVASSTATGRFTAGTWLYMSPEQLNRKRVNAACDIYALGVIAYELVTGRPPFATTDPGLLRELQEAGVKVKPRDLNPELPEAAQESILKALSYFPAERHDKARDFGDELALALAEGEKLIRPVRTAPPDPEGPTLRPAGASTVPDKAQAARAEPEKAKAVGAASAIYPRLQRRLVIAAAVLVVMLGGYAGWRVFRPAEPQPQPRGDVAADAAPGRTLTYWLSMQRPRDAKPFDTIGERVFEPGSQFWFNVQTAQEGSLYLFAEGHDTTGPSELNTLFPTPKSGGGVARLAKGRIGPVTGAPLKFRGPSGIIYLWVIWAERPVPLLDEIVLKSYNTGGRVSDAEDQTKLRTFIAQHREPKPEVITDDQRFRVTLRGWGEIMVDVRKLEYQP